MINNEIFLVFYNLSHQSAFFDWLVVFIAKPFANIVIVLAVIFLLYHHEVLPSKNPFKEFKQKWKEIVLVFFSGIFAWVVANLIKIVIQIPRPAFQLSDVFPLLEKTGYSFPSGHATFFMALGVSIFLSHKKAGYLFMFFALLIGIARIIAGVHFPIDILGGFVLGAIIAYLVRFLYDKIYKK